MKALNLIVDESKKVVQSTNVSDVIHKVISETKDSLINMVKPVGANYMLVTPTRGAVVICSKKTITADGTVFSTVDEEIELDRCRLFNIVEWGTIYIKFIEVGKLQLEFFA